MDSSWLKVAWARGGEPKPFDDQGGGVRHQGDHRQPRVLLLAPVVVALQEVGGSVEPLFFTSPSPHFSEHLWQAISSVCNVEREVKTLIAGLRWPSWSSWRWPFGSFCGTQLFGEFLWARCVPLWDLVPKRIGWDSHGTPQELLDNRWCTLQSFFDHFRWVVFVFFQLFIRLCKEMVRFRCHHWQCSFLWGPGQLLFMSGRELQKN